MSQTFVIAFFSLSSTSPLRWVVAIEKKQNAKSAHLEPQKKAHASLPQLRLLYVASPRLASPHLALSLGALFKTLLGGGYLLGLPVGFIADSIGATVGAAAAFLLGRTPVTLALVYIGTTLKDLSDVTHGWHDFSKAHWALIIAGLVVSVVVLICVTKVSRMLWKKHWLKKMI